ncbi:hypothetical protein CFP56_020623 [Quercus suber]|uniref:Uncharacterized protein n=1 Tax=Quercus suber TaxID=58331 RepID=A0AAW0KGN4_QUESU
MKTFYSFEVWRITKDEAQFAINPDTLDVTISRSFAQESKTKPYHIVAALLQCELGSYDRWQLPRCTIMNNNTRTYKNSFLILPISFINFLHQLLHGGNPFTCSYYLLFTGPIKSKIMATFWTYDEVICGGNAVKFYAVL